MYPKNRQSSPLQWQSQLLLLIVVPACCIWIFLQASRAWTFHSPVFIQAAGISIAFGLTVWLLRAATGAAAMTGALIAACLYLRTPGWRTALIPLGLMLILALAATRAGRAHKESLGIAEAKRGRVPSQVVANLGIAALTTLPLTANQLFSPSAHSALLSIAALSAALAEAAADTVSSELGQVFGGMPRLLTTLKPVPVGTDGGITFAGTVAGCIAAALVTAVAALTLPLSVRTGCVVFSSAIFGLFFDSWLGAVFERRGWLNNDAVNFLSTLASASIAAALLARSH
ncbi:DUF92 domain-containing protein [Acidobacterium sp. S8]|uniref:DUF92 domain-containing protein n=1 Tax=Acidobacterium sp. S8 TaxID=1641854 RepID=UPI00131A6114|nr:DUF92 domain-containing protein [Acidobacterium sp. S8]